ncbi:MAG: hypothetical protein ABJC19_09815 [Gemmatimonadota bacterium]
MKIRIDADAHGLERIGSRVGSLPGGIVRHLTLLHMLPAAEDPP